MTTDLVKLSDALQNIKFNESEIEYIKDKYCPNATPDEFKEFVAICQITAANPILREIYFIKYGGANPRSSIVFDYKFLIKKANESGVYAGLTTPEYLNENGVWVDHWVHWDSTTPMLNVPLAIRIGVKRKDWDEPAYCVVNWVERRKIKNDGKLQGEWANQPIHMLTKCCIAQAIRWFVPGMSNMYIREEFSEPIEIDGELVDRDDNISPTQKAIEAGREKKTAMESERRINQGNLGPADLAKRQLTDIKKKMLRLGIQKEDALSEINEILKACDMPTVESHNDLNNNTADLVIHSLDQQIADREEMRLKFAEGEAGEDNDE